MSQLEHQPGLAHVLHPRADEGNELTGKEETEIRMAKGAEEGLCQGCRLHSPIFNYRLDYEPGKSSWTRNAAYLKRYNKRSQKARVINFP